MKHFLANNYNYVIIASAIAWASAQILKTIINFIKLKSFNPERLVGPGGMPSSHSAFVSCTATSILRTDGNRSSTFALAFVIAIVVMYDATSVRQHAGFHAAAINKLNSKNVNYKESEKLKESLGHTPWQVLVGALLGILIAFLMPMEI